MEANASKWNRSEYLFRFFRAFRRGILTLPHLEAALRSDLRAVAAVIDRGTPTIELELAVQIMVSAKELVEDSLAAAIVLRQFVEADTFFGDIQAMEKLAAQKISDAEVRTALVRTLRVNGGVRGIIGREEATLERKLRALSEGTGAALQRSPQAVHSACLLLETFYENELIQELNYWRRKLEEADGVAARADVVFELCSKAPEIAKLLGVQCPTNVPWPVILIAIACALLCAHD